MKQYRFFYHLNKPRTKEAGTPVWSFHWRGTCYIVNSVACDVPTVTKANKRQPYAVVQGVASRVEIKANLKGEVSMHVHAKPMR